MKLSSISFIAAALSASAIPMDPHRPHQLPPATHERTNPSSSQPHAQQIAHFDPTFRQILQQSQAQPHPRDVAHFNSNYHQPLHQFRAQPHPQHFDHLHGYDHVRAQAEHRPQAPPPAPHQPVQANPRPHSRAPPQRASGYVPQYLVEHREALQEIQRATETSNKAVLVANDNGWGDTKMMHSEHLDWLSQKSHDHGVGNGKGERTMLTIHVKDDLKKIRRCAKEAQKTIDRVPLRSDDMTGPAGKHPRQTWSPNS